MGSRSDTPFTPAAMVVNGSAAVKRVGGEVKMLYVTMAVINVKCECSLLCLEGKM